MGLSHSILTHCHLHGITLIPKHISGELNILEDQGSQTSPIPTEWSLDRRTFRWLLGQARRHGLPRPQVDLFATRHNAQLSDFVSPVPDDWAVEVNALSLDWDVWTLVYLFPPVNILNRLLPHLWRSRAEASWLHLFTPRPPGSLRLSQGAQSGSLCRLPTPCLKSPAGERSSTAGLPESF